MAEASAPIETLQKPTQEPEVHTSVPQTPDAHKGPLQMLKGLLERIGGGAKKAQSVALYNPNPTQPEVTPQEAPPTTVSTPEPSAK